MPDTLTDRVLETLVSARLLTSEQVSGVREAAAGGTPVGKILAERGLVTSEDVGTALEDELGVPRVDLSSYTPDDEALALVPAGMAKERRVLPLFEIDGTLTVAVGDPMDVLSLDDIASKLGVELDPVLTDAASLLAAVGQYYGETPAVAQAAAPTPQPVPQQVPAEPEPAAVVAPAIEESASLEEMAATEVSVGHAPVDLDVLAVADTTRVTMLVTDILSDAASRGASRIHLLPYKDDFFLVYRVKGTLEKIASAPLSMQGALVDGFKSFAKVGAAGAGVPALGRVRTRLADQDLVLTASFVPTIAGQRAVILLAPHKPEPRGLGALGMTEAEVRALHAMVERGRGLMLVAAPVAEGRSTTYYALLAHAATSGKTAYSVEYSIEYEIPAVAQVLVNTSSAVPAASYFSAGLRQDTDVVAIDGLTTVDDIHLAVEAAGAGRLVIATFAAADAASAVRRMLDLGAEPHSLASALSLVVAQRLVRKNCPNCTQETTSELTARIPGAPKDVINKAGAGCASCLKSGFQGVTGIFEVLPFTDPMRSAVASGGSTQELAAAAQGAGMRPLAASGLAQVSAGVVSADELNRVLRFA